MFREYPLDGAVWQAIPGFEDHLERELSAPAGAGVSGNGEGFRAWGGLRWAPRTAPGGPPVFWTENTWLEPFRLEFDSISGAAKALREKQRNWAAVLHTQFRRGALIAEKLPPLPAKPRDFPWLCPENPMGAWSLLDAHTLIGSARCTSPFPAGRIEFREDHDGPPSRAYLKLQEALVLARRWPLPGEKCLDAGASPGGWSWVIARLGAAVLALDRTPLDSRVLRLRAPDGTPLVRFLRHDAFTLRPGDIGPVDWLFCDVVSYPARLRRWLEAWLDSGLARNFVCTIKMQGQIDGGAGNGGGTEPGGGGPGAEPPAPDGLAQGMALARDLARIPGSTVLHLHHNRHELTWIRLA